MVIVLIPNEALQDTETASTFVATEALKALSPSGVLTDYSPGWCSVATKSALHLNLPVYGVLPFPYEEVTPTKARSNMVFAADKTSYEEDPSAYLTWICETADVGLAWVKGSPTPHPLSVHLHNAGKRVIALPPHF